MYQEAFARLVGVRHVTNATRKWKFIGGGRLDNSGNKRSFFRLFSDIVRNRGRVPRFATISGINYARFARVSCA